MLISREQFYKIISCILAIYLSLLKLKKIPFFIPLKLVFSIRTHSTSNYFHEKKYLFT